MNKICITCSAEFEGNRKALHCPSCNWAEEAKPKEAIGDVIPKPAKETTKKKEKEAVGAKTKDKATKNDHSNFRQQLMKSKCGI